MTLPQETISLEGVLLQAKKQIEGSPESTLRVTRSPVIFRPLRGSGASRSTSGESFIADFVFRQVNFTSSDLTALFVLQNQDSDVNILFEDCHFSNRGCARPTGITSRPPQNTFLFKVDEKGLFQPKIRESAFSMSRHHKKVNLKNPKTRILGKESEMKIMVRAPDFQSNSGFMLPSKADSLTSSQKPIKMISQNALTRTKPEPYITRSKSHFRLPAQKQAVDAGPVSNKSLRVRLDTGQVNIQMNNCTISGFKSLLSISELKATRSISIELDSCGIVECGDPFRLGASESCSVNLLLRNCIFQKCQRVFYLGNSDHRVKVSKCEFSYNKSCVQLDKTALPGDDSRINAPTRFLKADSLFNSDSANWVSVSNCLFSYNEAVLLATDYSPELKLVGNQVKYSLRTGIVLTGCPRVALSKNVFESNFDPKLFQKQNSVSQKVGDLEDQISSEQEKDTLSRQRENRLRDVLREKKQVLIRLRESSTQITENQFKHNFGVLVMVEGAECDGREEQATSRGQKKQSRFNDCPQLDIQKLGLTGQDSFDGDALGLDSSRRNGQRPRPTLKESKEYKLEDSTVNQITPGRLKKRIPILKIFKRKNPGRRFQVSRRNLPNSQSYFQIMQKQSHQSLFAKK